METFRLGRARPASLAGAPVLEASEPPRTDPPNTGGGAGGLVPGGTFVLTSCTS
eukprot:CAMPEP_0117676498 /NCGR_PEP_ID=MMETSP0804-20121206/16204_1 /TAXON_ID=1074897 /ORGANISM="Tetraselmis astigmatica, Strain CCMP880" /LENGTH=53 /DNA_ID=CAMNT_0005485639 /DNA_START=744 /DNA_END=905 /DNA_ORIENTATION=+